MLVVQHIQFSVSNEKRRISGLTEMVNSPEVAPIPLEGVKPSNASLVRHVAYPKTGNLGAVSTDWPAPARTWEPPSESLEIGGVTITMQEDGKACVEFVYNRSCGAPVRGWAQSTLIVAAGEWAQVRYNGRFGGYDDYWYYEKNTINVSVSDVPTVDMFLRKQPDLS